MGQRKVRDGEQRQCFHSNWGTKILTCLGSKISCSLHVYPTHKPGKKLEFEGRKLGKLLFTVQEGWEGTKAFGRIQQVLT